MDMKPSIIANLWSTLLLAHVLYSAKPNIPKNTIMPARIKFAANIMKKNILANVFVHRVTIIAIRLRAMIIRAATKPTF